MPKYKVVAKAEVEIHYIFEAESAEAARKMWEIADGPGKTIEDSIDNEAFDHIEEVK